MTVAGSGEGQWASCLVKKPRQRTTCYDPANVGDCDPAFGCSSSKGLERVRRNGAKYFVVLPPGQDRIDQTIIRGKHAGGSIRERDTRNFDVGRNVGRAAQLSEI